jgi:CRP-like cAMP-binding protein
MTKRGIRSGMSAFGIPLGVQKLSDQSPAISNQLLSALAADAYERLLSHHDIVDLIELDVLDKAGSVIDYVYFPFEGIISLVMPMDGKSTIEIGLIGNEGMLGITVMLGVNTAPFRAVVQSEGSALRMPRLVFMQELERNAPLKRELKRYLYVLMSQLVQSSCCHRFHLVQERLARLLLMISDRAHSTGFYITQDLLAKMLGVRRVGVTKAAGSLQHQHLISYSRGQMLINDIPGLEKASCSCYLTDKETYQRVLTAHH